MSWNSYYTLACVALCATSFLIVSVIRRKNLFSLLVHPYSLICLFFAFAYQNRTQYNGMEEFTDLCIAGSFLLLSVGFWTAYRLLPEKWMQRISSLLQFSDKTNSSFSITARELFILLGFAVVFGSLILTVRWSVAKNMEEVFLSGYRNVLVPVLPPYRYFLIFTALTTYAAHCVVAILFIYPFIKGSTFNKPVYHIGSFLGGLFWVFLFFGGGQRQQMIILPFAVFVLSFCLKGNTVVFSRRYFSVTLPLFLLLSISMSAFSGLVRSQGLDGIKAYASSPFFFVLSKMREVTFYESHTPKDKKNLPKQSSTAFSILTIPEPIKPKEEQEGNHHTQTNNEKKMDSRQFLLSIHHRSNSDFVAFVMMYYGRLHPFYGFSNALLRWSVFPLPQEVFPKKNNLKPMHIQLSRDMHFLLSGKKRYDNRNFPCGLWGEGWMFGGITGSVLFSLLGGIYFGFIGKILSIISQGLTVRRIDLLLICGVLSCSFLLMGSFTSGQIEMRVCMSLILLLILSLVINTTNVLFRLCSNRCLRTRINTL